MVEAVRMSSSFLAVSGFEALVRRLAEGAKHVPGRRAIAWSISRGGTARREITDGCVVVLAEDIERCLADPWWSRCFDAIWLELPHLPSERTVRRTLRALLDPGLVVDLLLVQSSPSDSSPLDATRMLAQNLQLPLRILLDEAGLMTSLTTAPPAAPRALEGPPLSIEDLRNDVESFRSALVWTAKHLRRGELWYTRRKKFDRLLPHLLQRMLAAHAWATARARTSPDGLHLETWADPRALAALAQVFPRHDLVALARSLLHVMKLYRWLTDETAKALAEPLTRPTDERVYDWVELCIVPLLAQPDRQTPSAPREDGGAGLAPMEAFLHRLIQWAEATPDIRALLLFGSHAVDGRADRWSDLDIIVLSSNPDRYLDDEAWLRTFGNLWSATMYRHSPPEKGMPDPLGGHLVRALYEDALECDMVMSTVPVPGASLPDKIKMTLQGDHRLLLDKDSLLRSVPVTSEARDRTRRPPSCYEFQRTVSDVLLAATEAAKWLHVGEVWFPCFWLLNESMKFTLLARMLEWHASSVSGWAHDMPERRFEQWVDRRWLERVPQWFPTYDAQSASAVLLELLEVFASAANELATALGHPVPGPQFDRVSQWIRTTLPAPARPSRE
ncbi:MAG TPA: aminoglycoside 6-adenylyltransferase [Archangium sp.]|uniref:aminoglycoside 6-adenylyltransferase n=1 Tax=Archangium sp. TaxID=1872627 RepID=UPI002E357596|nr:aminoglycoside 6-adenylyltransferase [Archangium sp.]HEX5748070.1 aminoglycoside 6-adenylyltransferase [Archangium sp.]